MKLKLPKFIRRGLSILDHNIINAVVTGYFDCSYCAKNISGQSADLISPGMSKNPSQRSSQKRGAENLSSNEDLSQNPGKKQGTSTPEKKGYRALTPADMASNSNLHWPPVGGSNEDQAEDVTDGASGGDDSVNFVSPATSALKEVCEQMSQEMTEKSQETGAKGPEDGTESFASKAKKTKKLLPYTVFIVAGKFEDRPLIQRHYTAFEEFVFQKRIKLNFEENQRTKLEWMSYHGSYGVAGCEDKPSGNWIKNCAQTFIFEERHTRAYYYWGREESVVYGLFLKGLFWRQKHIKPNWALGQIFKANNLQGEWKHISWDSKRNSAGIWLEFEPVGADLIQKLDTMSVLNCLTCKPLLNQRKRKERSESDFIASLLKDPSLKDVNVVAK